MSISLRRRVARTFVSSLSSPLFRFSLCGLLLVGVAHGQAEVQTKLGKQLDRTDLAVNGEGYFNKTSTGTNYLGQSVTDVPGNTLGALVQIRYTVKPYVGFEFNYGYARFTQKFALGQGTLPTVTPSTLQVQSNSSEYTLGYVVHPPVEFFGMKPFVGGGAGTIAYKPTTFGGQGLKEQARATYFYTAGLDDMIGTHFGVRAQFRQSFTLAPDFGQNYLTVVKRTIITEPAFGVFLKF
jgi:hypothetical protein